MDFAWLNFFDLLLFDFDGLLVDTEKLHWQAYQKMCENRGFLLPWSLEQFWEIAHLSEEGLKKEIYALFPALQRQESNWSLLYQEKKECYQELLYAGKVELMPGVAPLLEAIQEKNIARAVVTNSTQQQTDIVKKFIPSLSSIPLWITREKYTFSKPHPDPYETALKEMQISPERAIGFEDSLKGIQSMIGAKIQVPLLVCPEKHPQMSHPLVKNLLWVPSFLDLDSKDIRNFSKSLLK